MIQRPIGSLISVLALSLCVACNAGLRGGEEDPDMNGGGGDDGGGGGGRMTENAAGCRGLYCDGESACPSGRRCVQNVCFPDEGTCAADNDCQSDTRCYMGACIPWTACSKLPTADPDCKGQVFTPDEFKPPVVGCSVTMANGQPIQSLSIPVVADLDKDGKPEIITIAFSNTIVVARGDNCQVKWAKTFSLLSSGQGSVAVADLDKDGFGEIVTIDGNNRVIVIDKDGNLLATAPTAIQEMSTYGQQLWSAPSIVDVDGVAPPEILAGAQVSRFVRGAPSRVDVLWTKPNRTAWWGSIPIAADLDGDGKPEVISSDKVFDGVTGADKTPPALSSKPFYAQVADFNMDKKPDLLLVQSESGKQIVSVYDYTAQKTIFGPYAVAEGGWGGPAVIADFDGDKVPDFGLASAKHYFTYALKCAMNPKPADCKGTDPGVLWSKNTVDNSSGGTGSSVFDFNGDGKAEVVYRDECWLRVYNGADGKTLFAQNITSNTCLELPVIADVNADGHADIVVTSDNLGACGARNQAEPELGLPWTGFTNGIYVLRDPMNRWMPSRALWNEHSYHITNINDDLSVPLTETPNWTSYNNYRQNVQGGGAGQGGLPDHTGKVTPGVDSGTCSSSWKLNAQICNRGGAPAGVPVFGTFYDADPRAGGKVICTAQTTMSLMAGACELVSCNWSSPPQGAVDLWFRVGDNGGSRQSGQCKDGNDLSVLRGASCAGTPG